VNAKTFDHDQAAEALGAYLLEALPDDERAAVEDHVKTCHRCQDEMAQLQLVADALPGAAPPVEPPPELKDRIMAIVNSEAELLQASGAAADRPPAVPPRKRQRRWSGFSLRPGFAAAAAALLLVAGGAIGFALNGGDEGGGAGKTAAAQVQGTGGRAVLTYDDGGHGVLKVSDMPPVAAGRVWEVWVKRPGRAPEPTDALFTTTRDGSATVAVPGVDDAERVMVTSERDGGSRVPTTPAVVDVQLT
jgi:anti-sigma-K factor RskA